jgi:hypothetical protein
MRDGHVHTGSSHGEMRSSTHSNTRSYLNLSMNSKRAQRNLRVAALPYSGRNRFECAHIVQYTRMRANIEHVARIHSSIQAACAPSLCMRVEESARIHARIEAALCARNRFACAQIYTYSCIHTSRSCLQNVSVHSFHKL